VIIYNSRLSALKLGKLLGGTAKTSMIGTGRLLLFVYIHGK